MHAKFQLRIATPGLLFFEGMVLLECRIWGSERRARTPAAEDCGRPTHARIRSGRRLEKSRRETRSTHQNTPGNAYPSLDTLVEPKQNRDETRRSDHWMGRRVTEPHATRGHRQNENKSSAPGHS